MPEITLYTVPQCADCEAIKCLLRHEGAAFTEKNVRSDPQALAEMQRRAGVRIAPFTILGDQVFFGPFSEQRPGILSVLSGRA